MTTVTTLLTILVIGVVGWLLAPREVLLVDERAVPGWVFIEIEPDCDPPRTWLTQVYYPVDQRGYGCVSELGKLKWTFGSHVRLVDSNTGRTRRAPRAYLHPGIWYINEPICSGEMKSTRTYLSKFVGTEEDSKKASRDNLRYTKSVELGIGCEEDAKPALEIEPEPR